MAAESQILKHQKMLIYEGITLFLCLAFGALALLYFIYKENKNLRERKDFLSLFTHDLKTTISSLRLMLERLSLKAKDQGFKSEVQEVQQVGTRLGQQLQNALQVSFETEKDLILEDLDFSNEINYIRPLWPSLSFKVENPIHIKADPMALRSISINLIQNALDHAEASEVVFSRNMSKLNKGFTGVSCTTPGGRKLPVDIKDFRKNLRAFQSIDGSGIGLRLTRDIMQKMGGEVVFDKAEDGSLVVSLFFKGVY